jgi:hypothetical protein
MGGPGSGNVYHRWRPAKKTKAEYCLRLGISSLVRNRMIRPGEFTWGTITFGGGQTLGIEVHATNDEPMVWLHYSVGPAPGVPVEDDFRLVTTCPRFGGVRWWFVCAGESCGRRAGMLYLPPWKYHFRCRVCHDLTYTLRQDRHRYAKLFQWLAENTGLDPGTIRKTWNSIGK